MRVPNKPDLEDFHEDIISKAMRGLGVGKNEMAKRTGSERIEVEAILSGEVNESLICLIADELNLDGEKLLRSARKEWSPPPIEVKGLKQFNLPLGGMFVNSYLVWDEATRKAWIFDTGPIAEPINDFIKMKNLEIDAIFLTHTHNDHIACLDDLKQKTRNPPVFVHHLEALQGCEKINEGFKRCCGSISLEAVHTHGHSTGGVTYLLKKNSENIAIVGDAIFAGSIGGGMISYSNALKTNREKIMTMPDEVILCPGHGPLSTIKLEKENNPFFPEY